MQKHSVEILLAVDAIHENIAILKFKYVETKLNHLDIAKNLKAERV